MESAIELREFELTNTIKSINRTTIMSAKRWKIAHNVIVIEVENMLARVRFIRYEGTEEKFGTQMNVIKDVIFEGNILQQVVEAVKYLNTQIKEKTYLGSDGLFKTDEEYPQFVRE